MQDAPRREQGRAPRLRKRRDAVRRANQLRLRGRPHLQLLTDWSQSLGDAGTSSGLLRSRRDTQPPSWWRVIAFGRYEELSEAGPRQNERDHAWSLLQKARPNWWEPGGETPHSEDKVASPPHLFFRINIEKITGRRALV